MKLHVENRKLQQIKANLFYTGIMTLVTAVMWIGFSVYTHYTKVETDPTIEKMVTPLRPNLDIESFQQYAGDRITLPEQFMVTSVTTEGRVKTTQQINPFSE